MPKLLFDWLSYWGTRFLIRVWGGKFEEKIDYAFNDISEEVYLVSKMKSANCTPFNTIIMPKHIFEGYSKTFRDYIFLHEVGHLKSHPLIRYAVYPIGVPLILVFFTFTPILIIYCIMVLIQAGSFDKFLVDAFPVFVYILLLTATTTTFFWLSEGQAELFALRKIGERSYLNSKKEMRQKREESFIFKCFKRPFNMIRYPPSSFIVWVFEAIIKS